MNPIVTELSLWGPRYCYWNKSPPPGSFCTMVLLTCHQVLGIMALNAKVW